MKKLNKKALILTSIVTLLPILLGLSFYSELPSRIAIHWSVNNEPNGWASRSYFVFGLPILMMVLNVVCHIGTAIRRNPDEPLPKAIRINFWIIPILTVFLYIVTLYIALGNELDIRKVVCLILGVLFIIMGNYMPKVSYNNRHMVNTLVRFDNDHAWRIYMRIMGITFISGGALILITLLLPPIATVLAIAIFFGLLIGISFYGASVALRK